MLQAAKVTDKDIVYDLGEGDGRSYLGGAGLKARAIGIEYNPEMAALARRTSSVPAVKDRVTIITGDIFEARTSPRRLSSTLYLSLPDPQLQAAPDHPHDEAGNARRVAPVHHARRDADEVTTTSYRDATSGSSPATPRDDGVPGTARRWAGIADITQAVPARWRFLTVGGSKSQPLLSRRCRGKISPSSSRMRTRVALGSRDDRRRQVRGGCATRTHEAG